MTSDAERNAVFEADLKACEDAAGVHGMHGEGFTLPGEHHAHKGNMEVLPDAPPEPPAPPHPGKGM